MQMSELLSRALNFFVRAIILVLDVTVSVPAAKEFARRVTSSSTLIAVPLELKVLTPAAQRALAEAERRHRFLSLPRR
jgi:hypothetical protein